MIARYSRAAFLRRSGLALAAAALGVTVLPAPAAAEGPGYGGNANALTMHWKPTAHVSKLALYAFGFRAGTIVRIRVGSADECRVAADGNGEVRVALSRNGTRVTAMVLVGEVTTTAPDVVQPGVSVVVIGETPAGAERTLIGAVPPAASGIGASQLVPVAVGGTLLAGLLIWGRRRLAAPPVASRHRHHPRHRR